MASRLLHTVKPSGGDFTSLSAAFNHIEATHNDLVSADVYAEIEIGGDWTSAPDTTAVNIHYFITDATHYLRIYTDAANRAKASAWDTGRYILSVPNAVAMTIDWFSAGGDHVRVDGLQMTVPTVTASYQDVLVIQNVATESDIRLSNLRLKGAANDTYIQNGISGGGAQIAATIWNCIGTGFSPGYDSTHTPFGLSGSTINYYNCLSYGNRVGFRAYTGIANFYDCVSFNNSDDFDVASATETVDYCASDDNDGTNNVAEGTTGGAAWPNIFTDAANGDFTLKAGVALIGAGGMAGSSIFSDDIDGTARGAAWDVGPHEYVASAVAPTVTTTAITAITPITASSGGNVTDDGGDAVTDRGVCWSTSANPTISDSHTHDSSGEGVFASSLTSLSPNTVYHVRAWATNTIGTSYGSDVEFTTGLDVSTGITGVSGTASVGTLLLSLALALAGLVGTGAVGDLAPSRSMALSGIEATASPGTMSPEMAMVAAGIAATGAVGTVARGATDMPVTGNEGTAGVGTSVPGETFALTGNTATGAVGTVTAEVGVGTDITIPLTGVAAGPAYPLSGVSGTGAVGTLTAVAASDITLPLTGVAGAGAVGDFIFIVGGGEAATGEVGSVTPNVSPPITGNVATAAAGDVVQSRSVALDGVSGSGEVGGWNMVTVPITGVEAAGAAGIVSPNAAPPISGNPATAGIGSVIQAHSVGVSGVEAAGVAGHLDSFVAGDLVLPLTGVSAVTSTGFLSCLSASPIYLDVHPRRRILGATPRKRILDVHRRRH